MATLPERLAEQSLARINAIGVMANEHVFNFQKSLDYGYEQDRHLPSLPEAIGLKQFLASEAERLANEQAAVKAAQTSSANA